MVKATKTNMVKLASPQARLTEREQVLIPLY
jgi:hypothetical protein